MEPTLLDADVIIIDEAHHFRNTGIKGLGTRSPSRYRLLQNCINNSKRKKQLYFLTATPVNNSIHDFRHVVELFTGNQPDHFASTLGIHNLQSHFIRLENAILRKFPNSDQLNLFVDAEMDEAEKI